MVMVAQLYKFAKNHSSIHLQWVNFMVCKIYLNKTVKIKSLIYLKLQNNLGEKKSTAKRERDVSRRFTGK